MRLSLLHAPTLKESPKEAEVPSHQLLLRAGFIRKLSAGIYDFLPLAVRTLNKISSIVREELTRAGAQEVLLPIVQPAELWAESGRWSQYGPELLRFKDRKQGDFCLGPTHEEVIVDLVRRDVRSYRQLPVNLFQIQAKFRDEIRPRFGLMRGREFIMKDGYSFDATVEGAKKSYQSMAEAYRAIFRRCGLQFRVVDADSGNIGGSLSQEFQVLADTGEDLLVVCTHCEYAANVEKATVVPQAPVDSAAYAQGERLHTPGVSTIEAVAQFLGVPPRHLAKTLLYVADGNVVAALVRGDHTLNEIKLKSHLGATELRLATEEEVTATTGAPVGFAGPVGLSQNVRVVADLCLEGDATWVVGGNAADLHLGGVALATLQPSVQFTDLRTAEAGDACSRCGAPVEVQRGIEVGHIFYLGTKYSAPMKCTFLDLAGKELPMVMGCYGIGVSRVMAAAVEQNHDEKGIIWPLPLAPYQVAVATLGQHDDAVRAAGEGLYDELRALGVEVLLDDRDERPGVKLKDAELMGHPITIVVGKRGLDDGVVEVRRRSTGAVELVAVTSAAQTVADSVRQGMAALQ